MRGKTRGVAIFPFLWLVASGCAAGGQVRYVYQDGQYGVIGLPQNTSNWPTYYRQKAERLMAQHFPQGYEIIRAEEVVEGSRTLNVGSATGAEIAPGAADRLLRIGQVGHTRTRNQSDSLKITECRILYKKADPGTPIKRGDYARESSWTPAQYIDPNAEARRHPEGPAREVKPVDPPTGPSPEGTKGEPAKAIADHAPPTESKP